MISVSLETNDHFLREIAIHVTDRDTSRTIVDHISGSALSPVIG